MKQKTRNALIHIRDVVDTMIKYPDRLELLSKNYEMMEDALRWQALELDGEEYIEASLALDECRVLLRICRFVEDTEMVAEEYHD